MNKASLIYEQDQRSKGSDLKLKSLINVTAKISETDKLTVVLFNGFTLKICLFDNFEKSLIRR